MVESKGTEMMNLTMRVFIFEMDQEGEWRVGGPKKTVAFTCRWFDGAKTILNH